MNGQITKSEQINNSEAKIGQFLFCKRFIEFENKKVHLYEDKCTILIV